MTGEKIDGFSTGFLFRVASFKVESAPLDLDRTPGKLPWCHFPPPAFCALQAYPTRIREPFPSIFLPNVSPSSRLVLRIPDLSTRSEEPGPSPLLSRFIPDLRKLYKQVAPHRIHLSCLKRLHLASSTRGSNFS
jgi:hypothetical protein